MSEMRGERERGVDPAQNALGELKTEGERDEIGVSNALSLSRGGLIYHLVRFGLASLDEISHPHNWYVNISSWKTYSGMYQGTHTPTV